MADDEFNEEDFYDMCKRAEAHYANDISRRHHRGSIKELLRWQEKSGVAKQQGMSPGEKAAATAAVPDASAKELEGRIKLVDNKPQHQQSDPVPVEDQPKGFAEASEKAHEAFMSAVTKSE